MIVYGATRKRMTFVNTTAIAYGQKIGRSLMVLVYAIAVVFTNVMRLRVVAACMVVPILHSVLDWELKNW